MNINSHLIIDNSIKDPEYIYNNLYKKIQNFYYLSISITDVDKEPEFYVFHYKDRDNAIEKLYEMKYNFICGDYIINGNYLKKIFAYNNDEIDELYENYFKDDDPFKAFIFNVQFED